MDTLNKDTLKQAIIKVLQDYLEFLGSDPESTIKCLSGLSIGVSAICLSNQWHWGRKSEKS